MADIASFTDVLVRKSCPVKSILRAFLTSDCAQAYHVSGEVDDGLSETHRGLVPEEWGAQ
ncbi:uncharacterized protein N7500_000137 [Penicillium coprophilum]|uniref:uncharacterized protein n=1 Tax=Penicillium coprophilum TaxID=36646 RepID=UPI002388F9DA|nr:uncharacterized protein N7500_000137 [Penicillium coprophilum]KAJ5177438.1 hypothetical protein N7500_000137 [Penicillium coprophilum]